MKRALITGGGGFLGGAIVARLRARGCTVRSLQRRHSAPLAALGVEQIQGDVGDRHTVVDAARDCDLIFHAAAKAGVWGAYADYHRCNVAGTENVIAAARAHRIARLIHTSTPSVVFSGRDENRIDETAPYATRFLSAYQKTKALAEQQVLAANGDELATVALRPHLIWGPGDPHLAPRIIERARRGRLRLVNARGALIDSTYIDNAADAHLLAADALRPGARCAGRCYFISNDEPLPAAALINRILAAAGEPPVRKTLPAPLAWWLGAGLELSYRVLGIQTEPPLTRFVARQLACAHWYDLSAAKRDLGYAPKVSITEGLRRLAAALRA